MTQRIILSIASLLSILFLPYFISAILVVLGMFYFKLYFEGLFILLISDFIYAAPEARYHGEMYVALLFGILLLITIEIFKKNSLLYTK